MRLRKLLIVLGTGVLAALIPLVVAVVPARAATDPRSAESAFVAKINSLRSSKGLSTLQVNGELTAIGRRWAAHMAEQGAIAHNPGFSGQVTQNWTKLGENVGKGSDVDTLFDAFVASPSHYKNLVDPDFQHVGVGVVVTADGTIYTAHQFMRLADAPAAAPAPAPAPAAAPAPAPKPAPRPAPVPQPAAAAPAPAAAPEPAPAAPPAPAVPPPPAHALQVLETLRSFDRPAA